MFNKIVLSVNDVLDRGITKITNPWSLVFIRWSMVYARDGYKVLWEHKEGADSSVVGGGKGGMGRV